MDELLAVLGVMAAIIAVITLMGVAERRRFTNYIKSRIQNEYGNICRKEISPERANCIPSYFEKHKNELSIDDITASDLELDRIFVAMDLTYSSAGEEMLYYALRTPLFDEEELKRRSEQMDYFDTHKKEREDMQFLFAMMGKSERYSLYDHLDFAETLKDDKSLGMHFIAPLLIAAAVALIFIKTNIGVLALIAAIIGNMAWYYKAKGKIQAYIVTLKYIMSDIVAGRKAVHMGIACMERETEQIKKDLEELKGFTRKAGKVFSGDRHSGDPLEVFKDYSNMVFHFDMIAFYHTFRQMLDHKEQIDVLHATLGYFEMIIAAASFRRALGDVCRPVYDGKEAAKEIYHPMIEHPVKNSYELKGNMLLTGSNASGKSTFLKTMAINQLLGQCFYFACADELHTSMHRLYTSMSLRDDLQSAESYFMVEIKAMRRILEASATPGAKIACYVDEVLRGTNTVERIAASTVILRYMAKCGVFATAATHDIELTDLLAGDYENYHFEEEIIDGDVIFNYRLMEGKATSRNAIRLLSVMGYDEKLVQDAGAMAESFMEKGAWI